MATPNAVAKLIKRDAKIRTIKLGELRVSPTSQRDLNLSKGKAILNSLRMEDLGTFTVSFRDGFYWLIDGQHRFWALREYFGEGWEEWEIEAFAYFGLTEAQEAEKFLIFNNNLAVDAYSKFKIGVAAELPIPTDINRVVLSLGLKVARYKAPGSVASVGSITKVYDRMGPSGLAHTLAIVRDAFSMTGFEQPIIMGTSLFWARYEGQVDQDELVKSLSRTPNGYKGIMTRAKLWQERVDQPLDQCVAASISDIYSTGRRAKGLGSWWKESKKAVAA